jgi:hypothetical protein
MIFNSLPLHDAVLVAIHISWEAARCDLHLHSVGLPSHLLVFEGFTNIELPRRESWGGALVGQFLSAATRRTL